MVGRKRNAPPAESSRRGAGASTTPQNSQASAGSRRTTRATPAGRGGPVLPDVYRDMLIEARDAGAGILPERPLKRRRRPGERTALVKAEPTPAAPVVAGSSAAQPNVNDEDDDDDIEFEDVVLPAPTIQTIVQESDDDDDDQPTFEDVDIDLGGPSSAAAAGEQTLELNLTAQKVAMAPARRAADRRQVVSKEERQRRVEIHKMHLLSLLSHVERRNRWCNDPKVQDALRPLVTDKMMRGLIPRTNQPQLGRSESLKVGLQETSTMFKVKYSITERGLRRALWAEDEELLKNYQLPDDIESTLEKGDFLEAAKTLSGSRDVGAQLFCALLRSAGVEARLVCSLQPLSCVPGAPPMPKPRNTETPSKKPPSQAEMYAAIVDKYDPPREEFVASSTTPSPRRRLGHPHAAAYHIPSMTAPPSSRPEPTNKPKRIRGESTFPVYWVEVLDTAYQKWHPVDPLVTCTQWRPRALEPPSSDRENCLTYIIAFESDGSAKDVTRRYAKAYNSKTRRMRIDGLIGANRSTTANSTTQVGGTAALTGERWWRRAMRRYRKPVPTDLEQIELNELVAEEAKEPMPRNVADFKDHPVYALERHLRRHEVLVPDAQTSGTVGAGSKAPLERIYRRRDVRVARSREKWYRLGRVVRDGEEPVKVLPKRQVRKRGRFGGYDDDNGEDEEEDDPDKVGLFGEYAAGGTPIYMEEQTDRYEPPAVVNGRVPKNKFGNVDVYVPSMVPRGGVHILHERAAQAAYILGVDYAPALTGFSFNGRQGTAMLTGVVVPKEVEEGIWAVIEGLTDLDAELERERRSRKALRMWSRFLKGLRIRERIWAGVNQDEDDGAEGQGEVKGKGLVVDEDDVDMDDAKSDVSEEGAGFLLNSPDILKNLQTQSQNMPPAKHRKPQGPSTKKPQPPKNWPAHIPYLTAPAYSPQLTPAQLAAIRTPPPSLTCTSAATTTANPKAKNEDEIIDVIPANFPVGPASSAVVIQPITDPRHPAKGQSGLFAARDLKPGELLLSYYGVIHVGVLMNSTPTSPACSSDDANIHTIAESLADVTLLSEKDEAENRQHEKSDYDLWLSKEAGVAVDAEIKGNEARFVNDYRGVPGKERANAEFRVVWDLRRSEWTMAVFVLPLSKKQRLKLQQVGGKGSIGSKAGGIKKGDEVLVSYGRGFWDRRQEEWAEEFNAGQQRKDGEGEGEGDVESEAM
ncbi:hypothetical protein B0H66DRAFT_480196 [Apodospora peruviana]|uniref:SET domain-containing protein n=1 Tax=Apodospora peruviana TaxID=516989 RepID=A0AAE0I0Z1_9PEZI|nr:hypothetical protein B0H66DRAFT_480196 [Apodospora peruviana]